MKNGKMKEVIASLFAPRRQAVARTSFSTSYEIINIENNSVSHVAMKNFP